MLVTVHSDPFGFLHGTQEIDEVGAVFVTTRFGAFTIAAPLLGPLRCASLQELAHKGRNRAEYDADEGRE
ncbi:hypothetical protein VR41_11445 [Streptomyces sp. NRRL B-1568]|nr:hypothetical protein VR41_11445 [Streptomyces sp. NRRL B-1568]